MKKIIGLIVLSFISGGSYAKNIDMASVSKNENKEVVKFAQNYAATYLSYATKVKKEDGKTIVTVVVSDKVCDVGVSNKSPTKDFVVESINCNPNK